MSDDTPPGFERDKAPSTNLKYQVEHFEKDTAEAFVNEMVPLGAAHHKEVFGDSSSFDPDIKAIGFGWETGALKVLTARSNGVLAGYFILMISNTLWDKTQRANLVSFYISPPYRGNGRKFVEFGLTVVNALGMKGFTVIADTGTVYQRFIPAIGGVEISRTYRVENLK